VYTRSFIDICMVTVFPTENTTCLFSTVTVLTMDSLIMVLTCKLLKPESYD